MIGHMKNDGRLGRNYLLGTAGDAVNALLAAAGHNLRLILAHLRRLFAWILAALRHVILASDEPRLAAQAA